LPNIIKSLILTSELPLSNFLTFCLLSSKVLYKFILFYLRRDAPPLFDARAEPPLLPVVAPRLAVTALTAVPRRRKMPDLNRAHTALPAVPCRLAAVKNPRFCPAVSPP
jgi:hypothetical protein